MDYMLVSKKVCRVWWLIVPFIRCINVRFGCGVQVERERESRGIESCYQKSHNLAGNIYEMYGIEAASLTGTTQCLLQLIGNTLLLHLFIARRGLHWFRTGVWRVLASGGCS